MLFNTQSYSTKDNVETRPAIDEKSYRMYLGITDSINLHKIKILDFENNIKDIGYISLPQDNYWFKILDLIYEDNHLILIRTDPVRSYGILNMFKLELPSGSIVGNLSIEVPDSFETSQMTVRIERGGDYYYALLSGESYGNDNSLLLQVLPDLSKYGITQNRGRRASNLLIPNKQGYFRTYSAIIGFDVADPTNVIVYNGQDEIGKFVTIKGSSSEYPNVIYYGTATQVVKVLQSTPSSLYMDDNIDMTTDTKWANPISSTVDKSKQVTYWITRVLEGLSYRTYLYRISTSPFKVITKDMLSFTTEVDHMTIVEDRMLLFVGKQIYIYRGWECDSTIPPWLWGIIVTSSIGVGLIFLASMLRVAMIGHKKITGKNSKNMNSGYHGNEYESSTLLPKSNIGAVNNEDDEDVNSNLASSK